jgi:hypothetical protein
VQKLNPDFRVALQQAEEQMAQQGGVVDRRFWIHLKQQRFYFETPRHRLICSIGFSCFMGFYSVSCNLLIKNYAQHIRISEGSIRVRSAMHSQCCALMHLIWFRNSDPNLILDALFSQCIVAKLHQIAMICCFC